METKSAQAKRIVIIGGVAGGATAAARARRVDENAEITIVERGDYVSFANCGLPYYISGAIKDRNKLLLATPESFYAQYLVKVLTGAEAVSIDRRLKTVRTKNLKDNSTQDLPYDSLILSQGAGPVLPPLPGIPADNVFTLRNMEDMDKIDDFIKTRGPRTAVVAGGGFIGIEMAEALHARGLNVTVVEKAPQIMINVDPEFAAMAQEELTNRGVRVITGLGIASVDAARTQVQLEGGSTVQADMVLFSVGVRPELELAKKSGLEIGQTGGILVNALLQSSDPDIYALGDMAEISHRLCGRKVRIPLAGPANRQGRIAGSNAAGEHETYKGAMGSAIVKIFEATLAMTGLSEAAAKSMGLDAASVTVHGKDHAGYYPGAADLSLKVVFNRTTGVVLGGLAFGAGADKRIDVISTAIQGMMTINDLTDLDLAYAPPFSSANDPVNVAGFVAVNRMSGQSPSLSIQEVQDRTGSLSQAVFVDVRTSKEYDAGHVEGAVNIPVGEMRNRLDEVSKEKDVLVYCQVGRRGHLAVRILAGHGIRARNISGGWRSMRFNPPKAEAT